MDTRYWKNIQPLRIPGGWTVAFNKLEDVEPEELSPEDERWPGSFVEDILYIYRDCLRKKKKQLERQRLGIDLGWYPDGDPAGSFLLQAVLNDNWMSPLLEFTSRSKKDVVNMLEKWLFSEFMYSGFIEENIFRKNHIR